MKNSLPIPPKESIIFEDDRLYVCSALYPITKGHIVVVWKNDVEDIHDLNEEEYDFLMDIVDVARDAQLKVLSVEKIYLLYMDEAKHVHWHLVPRYDEKGFNVFSHDPEKAADFPLVSEMKKAFDGRFKEKF
jgi:diadenosine tetraphosphate (Ap4A) HIT family hydrolase